MPFKSEAQRRKFYAMANRGEISKKTVKEWQDATGDKQLPERMGAKHATSASLDNLKLSEEQLAYLQTAKNLGKLAALDDLGLLKTASKNLLDTLTEGTLKYLAPIGIPAAAGAVLAGDDRRVEGALAGGIGGIVGRALVGHRLAPHMGISGEAKELIRAKGFDNARKIMNSAGDKSGLDALEHALSRGRWVGRLAGGAGGGLFAKQFMGPKLSDPSLASMPTANYDVGSHYYSGLLPDDEYSRGLW
jgi:hypothetical protein